MSFEIPLQAWFLVEKALICFRQMMYMAVSIS